MNQYFLSLILLLATMAIRSMELNPEVDFMQEDIMAEGDVMGDRKIYNLAAASPLQVPSNNEPANWGECVQLAVNNKKRGVQTQQQGSSLPIVEISHQNYSAKIDHDKVKIYAQNLSDSQPRLIADLQTVDPVLRADYLSGEKSFMIITRSQRGYIISLYTIESFVALRESYCSDVVEFSPDGKLCIIALQNQVLKIDTQKGTTKKIKFTMTSNPIAINISSNSICALLTCSDKGGYVWMLDNDYIYPETEFARQVAEYAHQQGFKGMRQLARNSMNQQLGLDNWVEHDQSPIEIAAFKLPPSQAKEENK